MIPLWRNAVGTSYGNKKGTLQARPWAIGAIARRCVVAATVPSVISAIIRAGGGDIEALGVTLAGLVPAVAEGILRDAVIVDGRDDREVRAFAEAAGAAYVAASDAESWTAGAAAVKGPWYLLLSAGDVPVASWTRAADRFLRRASGQGARPDVARFAEGPAASLAQRLRGFFAGIAQRHRLVGGLIVPGSVMRKGNIGGARVQRLPVPLERHGG